VKKKRNHTDGRKPKEKKKKLGGKKIRILGLERVSTTENYIGVLNFKGHELKFQLAVLYLINGKLNFGRKFQYLIFKLQNLFHNLQNLTAFGEQQIAELDLKIQITPVP
jgi:hypothetical protein